MPHKNAFLYKISFNDKKIIQGNKPEITWRQEGDAIYR